MSDESSSMCDCHTCPQNIRILIDGAFEEFLSFIDYHVAAYQELNPHIAIEIDLSEELESNLVNSKDWDGAIFPSQLIGSLSNEDKLWDLRQYIQTSPTLEWTEILPFFRNPSPMFGSDPSVPRLIPLDGDLLSMYYRRDLFALYNMTIPRTWDEYNQAAAFFDGLPLGPNGSPISGSCVSRVDNCGNSYWTSLILASMTQSAGTASGFFLNPATMQPLFGEAMEEALRLTREQLLTGHEKELIGECLESNFAFNEGNCALTYNWGNQIVVNPSSFDIGVAPTPGSTMVLDRKTLQLVNCTLERCPFGEFYEDIGIVNRAPYAAFGGWAAGISNDATEGHQYATADFFSYVSNNFQSMGDVLPNSRSSFVQPYRYSHVTSSNWIEAGYDASLASDYSETVRHVNSGNAALELRIPSGGGMRNVVDEEVFDYLLQSIDASLTPEQDLIMRQQSTLNMDQRIHELVSAADSGVSFRVSDTYRNSVGYSYVPPNEINNYINEDFRDAAWGLSGLMCVTCFTLMVWTIRHRNNMVMKAFQPFLLVQSTVGLLLLSSSIIPLGFDDSKYDVEVLNFTCMLSPWLYVVGFTIFFSSVYSKIRECIKIFKEPHEHEILMVPPASALRLCLRLLIINGTLLGLWTYVDPLTWERKEVEGGLVLEDGTKETFGSCRGGYTALGFAIALFTTNMLITALATIQAFKCRFLVLEYNEMQWLPLTLFPFLEVWAIGGPILLLVDEDPTVTFVVLSMMIVASTAVGGMSVFAPKDWYIRKYYHANINPENQFPERKSSAGILILKHPTVESQKQIEELSFKLEQMEGWNTELEIEIRVMQEKFRELANNEKSQVRVNMIQAAIADVDTPDYRSSRGMEEFEQTEISQSNDEDLAAVQQFQQVWTMPDEDEEEEHAADASPINKQESLNSMSKEFDTSDRSVLARSVRSVGIESAPDQSRHLHESYSVRSRPPESNSTMAEQTEPEDPLLRLMRMTDDDSEDNLVMAQTFDSAEDYNPRDPLARVAMMGDDEDDHVSPRGAIPRNAILDDRGYEDGPSDPLARLAAMGDDSTDDGPQDPLARLAMMEDEPDEDDGPRDPLALIASMGDDSEDEGDGPRDPLAVIASMGNDSEDEYPFPKDQRSRGIRNDGFSAEDDGPKDPLAIIAAMGEDSDDEDNGPPPPPPPKTSNSASKNPQEPKERKNNSQEGERTKKTRKKKGDDFDETSEEAKDIIARIIAMKLATTEEDDAQSMNSNPEDPLARIMSMDAEFEDEEEDDTGSEGAPMMEYLYSEGEDEDDDDAIIRKRDFRDLSSMIQDNDLEELERKAALLAESVKVKLTQSMLADLTQETDTTVDTENGMGYLVLARGGHKDAISGTPAMNGLDISKISCDDDGDRRFVSMSDSILDSPGRATNPEDERQLPRSSGSTDGSADSTAIRAGESSADVKQSQPTSSYASGVAQNDRNDNVTQLAGEPSQGEGDRRYASRSNSWKKDMVSFDGIPKSSPRSSPAYFKSPQPEESPLQNKSYSISDWVAVGGVAGALLDWSDSQSTSSYAESVPESVTSVEATTRVSVLDTPIASELDQLVRSMDWDGVQMAARKYETPEKPISSTAPNTGKSDVSTLEEKRRKKREIEAWRTSLARSFSKDGQL